MPNSPRVHFLVSHSTDVMPSHFLAQCYRANRASPAGQSKQHPSLTNTSPCFWVSFPESLTLHPKHSSSCGTKGKPISKVIWLDEKKINKSKECFYVTSLFFSLLFPSPFILLFLFMSLPLSLFLYLTLSLSLSFFHMPGITSKVSTNMSMPSFNTESHSWAFLYFYTYLSW